MTIAYGEHLEEIKVKIDGGYISFYKGNVLIGKKSIKEPLPFKLDFNEYVNQDDIFSIKLILKSMNLGLLGGLGISKRVEGVSYFLYLYAAKTK